jgi:hypothetical protein
MISLTDEQVQNWRNLLAGRFGVYALFMPVSEVERIAQGLQDLANFEFMREEQLLRKQEEREKAIKIQKAEEERINKAKEKRINEKFTSLTDKVMNRMNQDPG